MGMNFYFILRYTPRTAIGRGIWIDALIIAGVFTAFLVFYIPLVKGRKMGKPEPPGPIIRLKSQPADKLVALFQYRWKSTSTAISTATG